MTDITVIVLAGKEELHIGRCLEKLAPLEPRQIVVVESQKGDQTHEIAVEHGATCVWHDYPGNQAAQFQWALDQFTSSTSNLNLQTSTWILRLDADEYLTDELAAEIKTKLPQMPDDVDGVVLKRRHVVGWLGDKWVKRGMYPTRILRLFARDTGGVI